MNEELENKIATLSAVFSEHVNTIQNHGMPWHLSEKKQAEMHENSSKMYALEDDIAKQVGLDKKDIRFYKELVYYTEQHDSQAASDIKDAYPFFERLITTLNEMAPEGTCPTPDVWDEAIKTAKNVPKAP